MNRYLRRGGANSSLVVVESIYESGVEGQLQELHLQSDEPARLRMSIPAALDSDDDKQCLFLLFMDCFDWTYRHRKGAISFYYLDEQYSSLDLVREIAARAEERFKQQYTRSGFNLNIIEGRSGGETRQGAQIGAGRVSSQVVHANVIEQDDEPHRAASGAIPAHAEIDNTIEAGGAATTDEEVPATHAIAEEIDDKEAESSLDKREWRKGKSEHGVILRGKRYILGEPAGSFSQIPHLAIQPGRNQFRPDLAADISQIGKLLVLGAPFRGAMHYASGTVRQDSFAVGSAAGQDGSEWAIVVIADGVSEAPQSHLLADFLTQQAVNLLKEKFESNTAAELSDIDWNALSKELVDRSIEFCERRAQKKLDPRRYASRWASTLEFVVVQADQLKRASFVSASVAGDGAIYLVHPSKGWQMVKSGKQRTGELASNAVVALPMDPGNPVVVYGQLERGELILLTTDGLSDMIGDGTTTLGSFFQEELPSCTNLISFLQVVDVSMFQGDDDRTAISIQVYDT